VNVSARDEECIVDTNDGSQLASSVSNQRGIAFH